MGDFLEDVPGSGQELVVFWSSFDGPWFPSEGAEIQQLGGAKFDELTLVPAQLAGLAGKRPEALVT